MDLSLRPAISLRGIAAFTGVQINTWDSLDIEEIAVIVQQLSRALLHAPITVNYRGITLMYAPHMAQERFIDDWRTSELEGRVKTEQSLKPYE